MPPSFINNDKRLLIRYPTPTTQNYSFNKVRLNASDEDVYNLADALTSLQTERPETISSIVTKQLFW